MVLAVAQSNVLIQAFTMFLVFPVGAAIGGLGCGIGVFLALLMLNRRPARVHYWMSGLFGALGFAGTYVALYLTTYFTGPASDPIFNHSFTGVPLRSLVSFAKYLESDVASRKTSLFFHVYVFDFHGPTVALGATANWIRFALEAVGCVLGSLLALTLSSRMRYCETCKLYMKSKSLFHALPADADDKLQRIGDKLSAGRELRELSDREKKIAPKLKKRNHVRFAIEYCPRCFDGFLYVKLMRWMGSAFAEITERRQTIPLAPGTVRDFLL
jgi:hypothetical protein